MQNNLYKKTYRKDRKMNSEDLIQWDDNYKLGVDFIDDAHKELFKPFVI